jgi:small-conductance mechanosensitive channel
MPSVAKLLDTPLVKIGDTNVTVSTSLTGIVIVVVAYVVSRAIQAAIRRGLTRKGVEIGSGVRIATRILHYLILGVSGAVALQTAGIQLTALFAASAVFAVGFGFAMQNIAQNFVSGVILLVERTIRPGDIIELDGRVVRVRDMGIRAAIVRTRDEEDLIVPNTLLVQQVVKNLTLEDTTYRVRVTIGVHYRSDVDRVIEVLTDVAKQVDFRIDGKEPRVLLLEFAESAVQFEVHVETAEPWMARVNQSTLRHDIWKAFQEHRIEMAFPQLDLHLDEPVVRALARAS